ncbi:non-hydrolyzing UDP-N-acetylglucosamine 2-epimerase [Microbacterium enclense]|uniref:non-hydrolyzing UDP-N-acetylglucosamine 2-epimerase n=1 Tax=Microbacterium enclense TaxID=993073 RepID=UPI0034191BDF
MTTSWIDVVYGTRPEAIKCAPLVAELRRRDGIRTTVTVTGQHREMVTEINASFGIRPDADLDVFRRGAGLAETTSTIFAALSARWADGAPDAVVVQGDTASAALAAVAAYYAGARVIHLEAGLRSGDLRSPFPEEGNRRLIAPLASLHLAPTDAAEQNLLAEGVRPDDIVVTGNTGIDALHRQKTHPQRFDDPAMEEIAVGAERVVLVTVHRRESWGGPLARIASAVAEVVSARPDVVAVLPLHPNPAVRAEVRAAVGECERIVLCEPLPYAQFGRMLARAYCTVTDSGGVQEEAPALGVPALVVRETTERGEGVAAGAARLIGTRREAVVTELSALLDDPAVHARMSRAQNLYGDGRAAPRAADAIERLLGVGARVAASVDVPAEAALVG